MRGNKTRHKTVVTTMPTNQRPQIQAAPRKRLAVVYVRSATVDPAAAARQRALAALPRKWGWPKKRIKIIDADMGCSGLSARRVGLETLMELIDQGRVGLVVISDVSRLSRNLLDTKRFLTKASQQGVLIAVNGRICRSTYLDKLFGLRVHPPFGYVQAAHAKWIKDPDPAVRDAVRRAFDLYPGRQPTKKITKQRRQGRPSETGHLLKARHRLPRNQRLKKR